MDFDGAALPVRWLRPEPLRDPPRHAGADWWRTMLLEAGFLAEVHPGPDPEDPRAWIAGVQELLGELAAAEDALARHQTAVSRLHWAGFRDLPWWALVGIAGAPWLIGSLLLNFPAVFGGSLVLMLALGLLPFFAPGLLRQLDRVRLNLSQEERHRGIAEARARQDAARRQLAEGVAATLARSFVARGGPGLVACAADLRRIEAQLGPGAPTGDDPARDRLGAERARLRAAWAAVLAAPPADWTAEGLGAAPVD